MQLLLLAPFERGRSQGGSQRATAVAERLEARGCTVDWLIAHRRNPSVARKLLSMLRGRPALVGLYETPDCPDRRPWDVVLIAHSYLVPCASPIIEDLPYVVDFHNLEWRHLADGAVRPRSWKSTLRALYVRGQVLLMRRVERGIVKRADLSLFVSEDELRWARTVRGGSRTQLLRSVLPDAEARLAEKVRAARRPRRGLLLYVGTLTFPTNITSLERFLRSAWGAMRRAEPELTLHIAGSCCAADRRRFEEYPGITTHGFVDDLAPLLAACDAIVMPFEGTAGTSLRTLFFALAGIPMVGTPDAFRGFDHPIGMIATTPSEWVRAVSGTATSDRPEKQVTGPNGEAKRGQADDRPWEDLVLQLRVLAESRPQMAQRR